MAATGAISMIPLMFIYFGAYIKGHIKTLRSFFYIGTIHFMTIFLMFIISAVQSIHICHNEEYAHIFHHIALQLTLMCHLK